MKLTHCLNCKREFKGKDRGHFVPPSMGEPGFFACDSINKINDEEAANICTLCHHSKDNNSHGFDQNDAYLDENNKLIHHGRCTYCRECQNNRAINAS